LIYIHITSWILVQLDFDADAASATGLALATTRRVARVRRLRIIIKEGIGVCKVLD
jgi:hypothetical protein